MKFNKINAIYNKLAEDLLKDGEWKIISTIEIKHDLSEADIEIDVDEMMESLENKLEEINREIFLNYNQNQICGSTCILLFIYREYYGIIDRQGNGGASDGDL